MAIGNIKISALDHVSDSNVKGTAYFPFSDKFNEEQPNLYETKKMDLGQIAAFVNTTYTNAKRGNGIGICETSEGTSLTATLADYERELNGFVAVTFAHDVPASATLNVNNKGALPIYYKNAYIGAGTIKANDTVTFAYDGENYVVTSIGGVAEVEIGSYKPIGDPKLFVDESEDPAEGIAIYNKTEVDALTRHTRKTDFDLSVLKQAVAEGNLEKYGLKVGDQKTINGRTYVIAGLNPMKGTSTPYRVTTNHVGLIVIPHVTQAWNVSGNTYTGADGRGAGYANSDLHYYLVNTLLPLVETDLGANNLIGHNKLFTIGVNQTGYNRFGTNSGCSSGWAWSNGCKIAALSEVQVYGSTVWSSSGYDTGEACRQLDVFQKFSHTEIFGGELPWLRDIASATYAACANDYGHACNDPASDALSVAALVLFH